MIHPELFSYQVTGAHFLAERRFALLADEMGVGKTATAIAGADLIGARRILVLCPAIAVANWCREFQRWQTLPRVARDLARSGPVDTPGVFVTSYARAVARQAILARGEWDLLICDEAHALKTPSAERTRAVYGKRIDMRFGIGAAAKAVWLLTGTPAMNHPAEVWTHLHAGGVTPLGFWPFAEQYCDLVDNGFGTVIKGARADRLDHLAAVMRPITLRRRVADVQPDLPPLRWGHVVVKPETVPARDAPTPEERVALDAATAKLAGANGDVAAVTAAERMALATLRRWTGVAKAPAVAELARADMDAGVGKIVIFAIHRDVIASLAAALDAPVIHGDTPRAERQRIIDGFQGAVPGFDPPVIVCQLTVASTAITLTAAAHVLFAESSWVPAEMLQAAKRCQRIGQARPVLARVVSLAGSLDDVVGAAVVRKSSQLTAFEGCLSDNQRVNVGTSV